MSRQVADEHLIQHLLTPDSRAANARASDYVPKGSRNVSESVLDFYAVKRVVKRENNPAVRRILALESEHERQLASGMMAW